MKVFVDVGRRATHSTAAELRDYVGQLESAGASGVSVSDHLFASADGSRRAERPPSCEPLSVLAAVAGMSDRLELLTVVANASWMHPALLLRQFFQLAVLAGGERVMAGLGAGWNAEELEAIGMEQAPFDERMDRLEETLVIARQLLDTGHADLAGRHVVAAGLPLSPRPAVCPRLLVGGGSDRVVSLAGRYADVIDLQGDPRFGKIVGTVAEQNAADARRRALSSVDDLATRMCLVRQAATAAGRVGANVDASVQVVYSACCNARQVQEIETAVLASWARLPWRSLGENPFVLFGEPAHIAEKLAERAERFGLSQIVLSERNDVALAPAESLAFCRAVVPLLG